MPSLEERVAYLEGRVEDHVGTVGDLRSDVRGFREQADRRFDELSQEVDRVFDSLDAKISPHFTWLVGIQVAALVAIVGALLGR